MIDKIDNNILNTQNTLQESQASQGITNANAKNAYGANRSTLVDESNISQQAVSLYQHEQEISKYSQYLDNISEEEATREVVDLMEKGIIDISDEELAESMFKDLPLLNELFN